MRIKTEKSLFTIITMWLLTRIFVFIITLVVSVNCQGGGGGGGSAYGACRFFISRKRHPISFLFQSVFLLLSAAGPFSVGGVVVLADHDDRTPNSFIEIQPTIKNYKQSI